MNGVGHVPSTGPGAAGTLGMLSRLGFTQSMICCLPVWQLSSQWARGVALVILPTSFPAILLQLWKGSIAIVFHKWLNTIMNMLSNI